MGIRLQTLTIFSSQNICSQKNPKEFNLCIYFHHNKHKYTWAPNPTDTEVLWKSLTKNIFLSNMAKSKTIA